ncbi:MAG: hypothetical protein IJM41_07200 [Bacteroidales bacterium]|nr:hypothetical protein [Bacteroidales bacterium]
MRTLCTYVLLLACAAVSFAGPTRKQVAPSPADESRDTIIFPGGCVPASWKAFFGKLDAVLAYGDTDLKILHMGGSHVQGGMFTGRLREDLLSMRSGIDGSFGLVFPFSASRTNTPTFYTSRASGKWASAKNTDREPSRRLGLTGMAITAESLDAKVTLRAVPRDMPAFSSGFDQVQVCGYPAGYARDSASKCPSVILPGGKKLGPESVPEDSLYKFYLPALTDTVAIACPLGFTLTGVRLLNYHHGVTVLAAGVNGASLVSWAACADLPRDIERERPDMVILAVGINDAAGNSFDPELFKSRYNALLKNILEYNPDCAVLFVTNNDSARRIRTGRRRYAYRTNPNGAVARRAFLELGELWNAGVWDLFEIMGGEGSIDSWKDRGLARADRVHFTPEGYYVLGDLLFNALMDSYMKYREARR